MASLAQSLAKGAAAEVGSAVQAKASSAASSAAVAAQEKVQNAVVTTALSKAPGGSILVTLYNSFKDILRKMKAYYLTLTSQTKIIFIAVLLLLIAGIVLAVYYSGQKKSPEVLIQESRKQVDDTAATLGQVKQGLNVLGITEGFQDCPAQMTTPKEEIKLLNLQPFSLKQAGFIGSSGGGAELSTGAFDATSVQRALQAGIRTFVLQIDSLTTDRTADGFPAVGEPCLLVKNETGDLISTNAGSIQAVCQQLADHAFSQTLPQKDDPVLVILYINRTPADIVTNTREYIQFLSKIARQLAPLAPRHLRLTDRGDFTKQQLEEDLLTLPFTTFQKKFIIATNADTSPFRKAEELALTIDTQLNLDFWSNIRIYKSSAAASLGITNVAPANVTPRFLLFSNTQITDAVTTTEKIKTLSDSIKGKLSMMLPVSTRNPDTEVRDKALDQIGLNIIPLDIFSYSTEFSQAISMPWKTNSWKLKPALLR